MKDMKLVKESLDEDLKQKVIRFIERRRFSFDQEDDIGDGKVSLLFSTREHRSVYDEEYGIEDYKAAIEIKKELIETFPGIKPNIETCDEWVTIEIIIKK